MGIGTGINASLTHPRPRPQRLPPCAQSSPATVLSCSFPADGLGKDYRLRTGRKTTAVGLTERLPPSVRAHGTMRSSPRPRTAVFRWSRRPQLLWPLDDARNAAALQLPLHSSRRAEESQTTTTGKGESCGRFYRRRRGLTTQSKPSANNAQLPGSGTRTYSLNKWL